MGSGIHWPSTKIQRVFLYVGYRQKRIKNSKGNGSIYYNKEPLDMAQVSPYSPLLLYKVDNFHNLEANMQTKTEA